MSHDWPVKHKVLLFILLVFAISLQTHRLLLRNTRHALRNMERIP